MNYCVLFNPLAGNHTSEAESKAISALLPEARVSYFDITAIGDIEEFFKSISPEDGVIIAGGDGTLNKFINLADGVRFENRIFYFATGSGNDFLRDINGAKGEAPIDITEYIKDLPTVTVNGKSYRVLNGVGFGIDGYCCEVGDELRKTSQKKINYTAIAIKGLLFHYKPKNAVITVDGVRHEFKRVWLAPTMHGRFYGGGMIPTPGQSRLSAEKKLSTLVYHNAGKLKALIVFPSIFKGEHIKKESVCRVLEGREITVQFDRPTPLQIDGETITGVTEYTMKVNVPVTAR